MDLVWVEQLMAKKHSVLRNLGFENTTEFHCYLNMNSKKVYSGEDLGSLELLQIAIGKVILVEVKLKGGDKESKMRVTIDELKLKINQNLAWAIENSGLQASDSIAIVGQTIQLKLNRSFQINETQSLGNQSNQVQIALSWTPSRKLISIQAHFNLDPELIQSKDTQQICSTLSQLRFDLSSRDFPVNGTSELSFFSPETSQWKLFSALHHEEVIENFADANYQNLSAHLLSANRTIRDLSCSRWMLLNNIHDPKSEMDICRSITDGCNLAAYFVDRQDLVRVPNQCLACALSKASTAMLSQQITRFGSRRIVNMADLAQVVFVLDGSCHQKEQPQGTVRFMHQLNRLAKVIEKEFRLKRVRTRFMITTPDSEGKYKLTWPIFEKRFNYSHLLSRDAQLNRNSSAASMRFPLDPFLEPTWPSNGKNSFDFLHLFPYPPGRTSRHFVMIDCLGVRNETAGTQGNSCVENEIDFSTARTMFLHSNNFIHIISGLGISRRPLTSPKMRRVIGLDWRQAIFDNETAISTSNRSTPLDAVSGWLRKHILPQRDICHVLALETNGSVFSHRVLKQANRRTLAKRIVDNLATVSAASPSSTPSRKEQCYRCDCMLNKDRMSAHEECILCKDRKHTLLNPYRKGATPELSTILGSINATTAANDHDWHFDTKQEWTEEDERHFREIHGQEEVPAEEEEEVDE